MKTRLIVSFCLVPLCLLVFHGAVMGQEATSGTIEGNVTDAEGMPLPGVTVTL